MKITSKITMNLQNPGIIPILCAVQEDRYCRDVEITLMDGRDRWMIPGDAAVVIRFRKADGRGGDYDTLPDGTPAWQAAGNVLRIALAPQVLTMPGNVQLTVTLLRGDSRISTFPIPVHVEGAAKGISLDSGDYSNITGFLRIPEKAIAGQLLQVAAVDEQGRVTETEAVPPLPGNWEKLVDAEEIRIPEYTNRIALSVDENGDIFNGCGYMTGKMLNADGSVSDNATTVVSGFIPVKPGDVIRIQDPGRDTFSPYVVFALYKADKATANGIGKMPSQIISAADNVCGVLTMEGNTVTWTLDPMGYWLWNDFAWLRVTTFSADSIVTVNEEITTRAAEQYVLKPEVKVREESVDFEMPAKPLTGKTLVGFGDSTFAMCRDSTSVLSVVQKKTGAVVHNGSFGGCRMAVHPTEGYAPFSMWALAKAIAENDWTEQDAQAAGGSDYFPAQLAALKALDFAAVDGAIIHYGANDFTGSVALDNADNPMDTATLCGALRYSVETLLTAYPKMRIFLSLPAYRYWPDTGEYAEDYVNSLGLGLADYAQALGNVAAEYHLPVLDCFGGMGINRLNVAALTTDGTHHNQAGRQRLGEFIAAQLF